MNHQVKLADIGDEKSLRVFMRRVKRHPAFSLWKRPFDLVMDVPGAAWRMTTSGIRHLPTAVIVGAQKAGTTQLYAYLVTHPRCFGAAERKWITS